MKAEVRYVLRSMAVLHATKQSYCCSNTTAVIWEDSHARTVQNEQS